MNDSKEVHQGNLSLDQKEEVKDQSHELFQNEMIQSI